MLRILFGILMFFWTSRGKCPADRYPEGTCWAVWVLVMPSSWNWPSGSDRDSGRGDWKLLASGNPTGGFMWISFPLKPPEVPVENLGSFFSLLLYPHEASQIPTRVFLNPALTVAWAPVFIPLSEWAGDSAWGSLYPPHSFSSIFFRLPERFS